MQLEVSNTKTIREVQQDFANQYPFLKLDFYKVVPQRSSVRERLPDSVSLKLAGLKEVGSIDISSNITVGDLEKKFNEQFGLIAQVSRKSGGVWLETTMTDKWSLYKQNEYGKEIIRKIKIDLTDYNPFLGEA